MCVLFRSHVLPLPETKLEGFMFNIMKQACERNTFGGGCRAEIFIQAS